jgi:hypothetical protein
MELYQHYTKILNTTVKKELDNLDYVNSYIFRK